MIMNAAIWGGAGGAAGAGGWFGVVAVGSGAWRRAVRRVATGGQARGGGRQAGRMPDAWRQAGSGYISGLVSTHSLARPGNSPARQRGRGCLRRLSGGGHAGAGRGGAGRYQGAAPDDRAVQDGGGGGVTVSAPMTAACTTHRWPMGGALPYLGHRVVAPVQDRTVLDVCARRRMMIGPRSRRAVPPVGTRPRPRPGRPRPGWRWAQSMPCGARPSKAKSSKISTIMHPGPRTWVHGQPALPGRSAAFARRLRRGRRPPGSRRRGWSEAGLSGRRRPGGCAAGAGGVVS